MALAIGFVAFLWARTIEIYTDPKVVITYLAIKKLLNDLEMILLPVVGIVRDDLEVEGLERILLID